MVLKINLSGIRTNTTTPHYTELQPFWRKLIPDALELARISCFLVQIAVGVNVCIQLCHPQDNTTEYITGKKYDL